MLKKTVFIFCAFLSLNVFSWGVTGHRTVGEIANMHLSKKAKKKILCILDKEPVAVASTWMDEIRSDSTYDHTHPWHWVTIPDGHTYESSEKNPHGDLIETTERLIKELKEGNLSKEKEAEALRMLIHLIGDLHQPLHVGREDDMGGNQIKVKWFWEPSNLHSVWDSGMIDSQKFSYTELANILNTLDKDQIKAWQAGGIRDWAMESMNLRNEAYDYPEHMSINYEYRYRHWGTVELRLAQAGIRLAKILNDIYG